MFFSEIGGTTPINQNGELFIFNFTSNAEFVLEFPSMACKRTCGVTGMVLGGCGLSKSGKEGGEPLSWKWACFEDHI